MGKLKKADVEKLIENATNGEDWKKIKKLTMANQIKLGDLRKKFCQGCSNILKGKVRIKNKIKSIECTNCHRISRWKL